MSYESVVLANGVDALWPLDELVADHSILIPQLSDISGNTNHALCFADQPGFPQRHVHDDPTLSSPILTAPTEVMSGRIGHLTDPTNRLDEFAWQGWAYNDNNTGPKTMICRSGHFGAFKSNIMGYGSGGVYALAYLYIGTTPYVFQGDVSIDAWHYLVLVKETGVIRFWVDACLAQETVAVGDINVGARTEFYLGTQYGINTNIWHSRGSSYLGIGPPITEAQIIENYEEAGYTQDCADPVPGYRYYCDSVIDPDT